MLRKTASTLTGSVALLIIVLASLALATPAQASPRCDPLGAGTQAYAECMVRESDRQSGYGSAFNRGTTQQQQTPAPTRVVEVSSTQVWELAAAGAIGAAAAVGLTLGISRLGQRRHATALR